MLCDRHQAESLSGTLHAELLPPAPNQLEKSSRLLESLRMVSSC